MSSTAAIIYLDHNATTPVLPEVRDAMLPWLGEQFGNPSSTHALGKRARQAVEQARAEVAALLGAEPDEIVFTSGGTESNNLALRGITLARPRILISAIEHPAVAETAAELDVVVDRLPVDSGGRVDLGAAEALLGHQPSLVSVMLAHNETGVIQPLQALTRLVRAAGDALVHTDAAQAVGKIPVDVRELDVDLATVAGHKMYAPCGVGALFMRRGVVVNPYLYGGGQERGIRPGTVPVALVVGLGTACRSAQAGLHSESERQRGLRERLWTGLRERVRDVERTAAAAPSLPNTLHVRFGGCTGTALLAAAPEIAASTGSACHAADGSPGALLAMGIGERSAAGAVRLSLGRMTTPAEIDRAISVLTAAHARVSVG